MLRDSGDPVERGIHGNRQLPANYEAEQALLGLLILNGQLLDSIADDAGGRLKTDDFCTHKHQLIYDAILARAQAGTSIVDSIFIQEYLRRNGTLAEAGGSDYIMRLVATTAQPEAAGEYAAIIRDTARRRRLIVELQRISALAYEPGELSAGQILERASEDILQLADESGEQGQGPRDALSIANDVLERISEDIRNNVLMRGVPTGFTELDALLSGLRGESLYILAARPGVGKTTLAMNIVENVATNEAIKQPALVFSLEMPAHQLILRMLSTFGRVSTADLTTPQKMTDGQWHDIMRQVYLLADKHEDGTLHSKLYIDDTSNISLGELCARARRIYNKEGLSLIMVDYIQLMHGERRYENRAIEVGEISRQLKILAKELNVPVLALSQLRREVEGRKDNRPMNSDLRESGALEQDADVIMLIHRTQRHLPLGGDDGSENMVSQSDGPAILMVSKNRHGATSDIKLNFQGEYTAFYDYMDPRAQYSEEQMMSSQLGYGYGQPQI